MQCHVPKLTIAELRPNPEGGRRHRERPRHGPCLTDHSLAAAAQAPTTRPLLAHFSTLGNSDLNALRSTVTDFHVYHDRGCLPLDGETGLNEEKEEVVQSRVHSGT